MKNTQMAEFLKQARLQQGLSQSDVSSALGFTTSQFVSNWERGKSLPPVQHLKALGRLYKVDAVRLLDLHLQGVFKWNKEKITKRFQRSK